MWEIVVGSMITYRVGSHSMSNHMKLVEWSIEKRLIKEYGIEVDEYHTLVDKVCNVKWRWLPLDYTLLNKNNNV